MSRKKKTPPADAGGSLADAGGSLADAGAPDLSHIAEGLRALAAPIGGLVSDPANARTHDERNLRAIAASYRVYGQRKPIVVNRRNSVVLSGNGQLEAARALGWSHLAVVFVDDDPATAAGYAIADNRTAELADWDAAALGKLLHEVSDAGDAELGALFDELAQDLDLVPAEDEESGGDAGGDAETLERKFQVIVECKDEQQQLEILERFQAEGIEAKALTL